MTVVSEGIITLSIIFVIWLWIVYLMYKKEDE